jgi:hypothetical protein
LAIGVFASELEAKNEEPPTNGQFCYASIRENTVLLALYFRGYMSPNSRGILERNYYVQSGLSDVPHRFPLFGGSKGPQSGTIAADVTAGAAGVCIPEWPRNGGDDGTRTRGLCRDSSSSDDGGSEPE